MCATTLLTGAHCPTDVGGYEARARHQPARHRWQQGVRAVAQGGEDRADLHRLPIGNQTRCGHRGLHPQLEPRVERLRHSTMTGRKILSFKVRFQFTLHFNECIIKYALHSR